MSRKRVAAIPENRPGIMQLDALRNKIVDAVIHAPATSILQLVRITPLPGGEKVQVELFCEDKHNAHLIAHYALLETPLGDCKVCGQD